MSLKDKLLGDIRAYSKESKWEELLTEQALEVLELRPYNAFAYLHERSSVRGKLDHAGRLVAMVVEVGFYCAYFDPLLLGREQFANRVMGLAIEKYQQHKIRSKTCVTQGAT